MNDTNAFSWFALAAPAVAAFFCLGAALALVSLIRLNKGARINRAWGLLAFGLACFSLAAFDRTFELLDLPSAASVRDALSALGAFFILIGAVQARGLYRNLVK